MTNAERSKAWREKMRLARRCLDCGAGLQEKDGLFCLECTERRNEYKRRTPRIYTREQKDARNQAKRERVAAKLANDQCSVDGCDAKKVFEATLCKECRKACRISSMMHEREKTWPRIAALNLWRAAVAPMRGADGRVPMGYRKTRKLLGLA